MALNLDMESMNAEEKLVTALAMAMTAPNEAASDEWAEKAAEFAKAVPNSRGREDIRVAAFAKADEIRLAREEDKMLAMQAPTNAKEALTMALFLSITAPDDEKAAKAMELVQDFASGMSEPEIEACKTAAQIQAFGAEHVAAEQAAGKAITRARSR